MTPNITKSQTDTSKFTGTKPGGPDTNPHNNNWQNYNPAPADDDRGKSQSKLEATNSTPGQSNQGADSSSGSSTSTSAFRADGGIGKQFTTAGALGGTAQKIGGPLSENGMIGSAFKPDGALGSVGNKLADTMEGKK